MHQLKQYDLRYLIIKNLQIKETTMQISQVQNKTPLTFQTPKLKLKIALQTFPLIGETKREWLLSALHNG